MENQSFNSVDEKIFEKLKKSREKKVPGELMTNFSSDVEEKLRKKSARPGFSWNGANAWAMAGVPAFAVLVLASFMVFKTPAVEIAQLPSPELSDEAMMAALIDSMDDEDFTLEDLDQATLDSLEVS